MGRYVAIVCDPHGTEAMRTLHSLRRHCLPTVHGAPAWSVAFEGPGMLVIHQTRRECKTYPLSQQSGVIVGQLFDRQCTDYSRAREVELDDAQSATIVRTAGKHLVEQYWGTYFALLYDRDTNKHHVFRDPIATMPCFHARYGGADIFFSHWGDCARLLPIEPVVDRQFMTKWLLYSGITTDETGIEGVKRVTPSERLTLCRGSISRAQLWDPVAIAANPRFAEPKHAADMLRSTLQNVIDAWASRYQTITHRLSGGLDSSIVAGCLARAASQPKLNFIHIWIESARNAQLHLPPDLDPAVAEKMRAITGDGDERYFARQVARRWNVPLVERPRNNALDLEQLRRSPPTATPSMYFTAVEIDDAELEMIATHGTQAFFTGQGGDSVLLATGQPFPSIDHAYLHGLGRGLWQHIVSSTALSKESLWAVLGKTLQHGLLRRPYSARFELLDLPTLVPPSVRAAIRAEDLDGKFGRLAAASTLPPGKKNHVEGITCEYQDYVFYAGERSDHIDPLNAQPVWELMLSIPTYTALHKGVSRGLARTAFQDLLPKEIFKRQIKGTGSYFYQNIVRNNRACLRDQLADGLLVQQGFLDRARVLDCLASEEPSLTISAPTLLSYFAAEIWLQQLSLAASAEARASAGTALTSLEQDPRRTAARSAASPRYAP